MELVTPLLCRQRGRYGLEVGDIRNDTADRSSTELLSVKNLVYKYITMAQKDLLEELKEENKRLKRELEISKLERENKELREQIGANRKYIEFGDQPTFIADPNNRTIRYCSNVDLKELSNFAKKFGYRFTL